MFQDTPVPDSGIMFQSIDTVNQVADQVADIVAMFQSTNEVTPVLDTVVMFQGTDKITPVHDMVAMLPGTFEVNVALTW